MSKRIAVMILNNWHLKLISLGLAAMSWFLVTTTGIQEVEIPGVAVEIMVPDSVSVWETSRDKVKVQLKGPRAELSTVRARDLLARYEVPKDLVVEGHRMVDVDCRQKLAFSMPAGVRVTGVDPPRLHIKLVPKIKDMIPVAPEFEGAVQAGHEIAGTVIMPRSVTVAGPEPIVKTLKSVKTRPVNIEGRFETFKERINVENRVRDHVLEIGQSVEVQVIITEQLATRVFEERPIMIMRPSGQIAEVLLVPDRIDVTVTGPKQVLENVVPEQIVPFVRIGEEGKYRLPVEMNDPPGVDLVGELPEVEVTVRPR